MVTGIVAVAAAVVVAGALMYVFPKATALWYGRVKAVKEVVLGLLALLIALLLVTSGSQFLMVWGFFVLILTVIRVAVYGGIFDPEGV